ncbi:MAG: hypothetical protein JWP87_2645 [Labilithrix sp.]|nr:hypothetical protein [Labilithrix sp.]
MRNIAGSSVLALLVTGVVASTVACSSADEEKKSAWSCERVDVPLGEVTRCTAVASATDAPSSPSFGKGETPGAAAGGTQVRTYGVPEASDAGATGEGDTTAPPPPSAPAPPSDTSYECPAGGGGADCPTGDLPTPPPSESSPSGPDECSQVEDLPYCGGGAGSAPSGPPVWTCTKDMQGNKVCESTPTCSPGSHASKCGACVLDNEPGECVPPSEGGCWVTGGGFIVEPSIVPAAPADGHDNYGGNAKQMKKGGVQGHWNHVDHGTQNHAKGRPEYLFCRHVDEPGPGGPGANKGFTMNQVYFGGHAEWRSNGAWASGYWFDVVAKDHGEPGSTPSPKNGFMVDTYHFTIRKMDDPAAKVSGPVVYEVKGGLVGGNIQMHPPNNGHPGVQSPLPAWVSLEP